MARPPIDLDALARGVLDGDRTSIGRSITLIESRNPDHRIQARELLARLVPASGGAHRVGITGVPGVGKSTTIDSLGSMLTASGKRVAVLAVDPTSQRTGGSILGDKTRMARLAVDPLAFVRPSPSSGTLGGVTRATRETMLICEAAGFDVVIVETVGVGQSETLVADMVDLFCVLALPGAGDELQGIKKGVIELADLIAVNKADGANLVAARQAASDYRHALHMLTPASPNWTPPVLTISGLGGEGLDELWDQIELHHRLLTASGEHQERRREQQERWMWSAVEDLLMTRFKASEAVAELLGDVSTEVADGQLAPTVAAERLLDRFEA